MANLTHNRPLSPHLQIYKPIPTMIMSIMHRITGGALYFGTLLVLWWLVAAASGEAYFNWVNWFMGTLIGKILLPEVVANVCFGGPKRNRLFICATSSVFALYVNARGCGI